MKDHCQKVIVHGVLNHLLIITLAENHKTQSDDLYGPTVPIFRVSKMLFKISFHSLCIWIPPELNLICKLNFTCVISFKNSIIRFNFGLANMLAVLPQPPCADLGY